MRRRETYSLLLQAGRIVLAALVAVSIAAGPYPAYAFSVGEERELGEKLLSIIRREMKLIDDPDVTQYTSRLGKSLLAVAGPQYFDFHFFIVNNKEFNAFAAPSGLVFIHSGLIDISENEGELIGVLAHEIGHVASRHIADRISKSTKVNLGTTALVLAGIAMGGGPLAQALITGSLAAGATMNLKFSRQDEEESDRLAYKWMISQGRDPKDMVGMLKKMRRISRYRSEALPGYLLTHPEPENRIHYIEDLLITSRPESPPKPWDDFSFKRIKHRLLSITKEPTSYVQQMQRETSSAGSSSLEDAMARYGLAQAYFAAGNLQKAAEIMENVIALLPDRPILMADLGTIYFAAGQNDKALPLLEKAVSADSDCAYSAFQLARALQTAGQLGRSLAIFTKLTAVLPFSPRPHYYISQIKGAQGDPNTGHYHLGVYHWYSGDPKNARYHLRLAMKGTPAYSETNRLARELLHTIDEIEKGDY